MTEQRQCNCEAEYCHRQKRAINKIQRGGCWALGSGRAYTSGRQQRAGEMLAHSFTAMITRSSSSGSSQ